VAELLFRRNCFVIPLRQHTGSQVDQVHQEVVTLKDGAVTEICVAIVRGFQK
jgi:hypothetical protein